MPSGAINLAQLYQATEQNAPWLVDLTLPDVGGGHFDPADLSAIDDHPTANALRISGLNQEGFERVVSDHGQRFSAIHFWKCPRIEDLSALETLPGLRLVSFYWNQRASRLWDLSKTPNLVGLRFYDFTRLHDLSDLASGGSLVELDFGDAVWDKSVFETLEPLAALHALKALKLSAKRIDDGRVESLGALVHLDSLAFSSKQFTTRQVAWLRARLPDSLASEALEPLRRFSKPLQRGTKELDVLLVGKRKPFLNSAQDAGRIRRHVADFEGLVAQFRADPTLMPE